MAFCLSRTYCTSLRHLFLEPRLDASSWDLHHQSFFQFQLHPWEPPPDVWVAQAHLFFRYRIDLSLIDELQALRAPWVYWLYLILSTHEAQSRDSNFFIQSFNLSVVRRTFLNPDHPLFSIPFGALHPLSHASSNLPASRWFYSCPSFLESWTFPSQSWTDWFSNANPRALSLFNPHWMTPFTDDPQCTSFFSNLPPFTLISFIQSYLLSSTLIPYSFLHAFAQHPDGLDHLALIAPHQSSLAFLRSFQSTSPEFPFSIPLDRLLEQSGPTLLLSALYNPQWSIFYNPLSLYQIWLQLWNTCKISPVSQRQALDFFNRQDQFLNPISCDWKFKTFDLHTQQLARTFYLAHQVFLRYLEHDLFSNSLFSIPHLAPSTLGSLRRL